MDPPHNVRMREVKITTEGMDMIIVVTWKNAFIVVPIFVKNI